MAKTTKKAPAKTPKKAKVLSLDEVKVGDRVLFNNGKERLTLTITKIDKPTGEIEVKWRTLEGLIFDDDFERGYVTAKPLAKK
ncbi:hypothetical protein [Flectobacillus roseus]|uniref:hypothetical protein n=1 Tax=Flectobacillus roseus TaxID=502259 RepID=UPI0024B67304|nr:hypothetical protein [Flectobacillus roseus]MDI9872164.1 hypothetical protein [Flectobacillus roseus]